MANLGLKNKNPGNLKDPSTGEFRVFNTPQEGDQALIDDIKIKQSGRSKHIKPGASIQQLAEVWAPASDNNVPANWANNVAKTVGVSPDHKFDQIPADRLAQGIRVAEGTSTMKSQPSRSYSPQEFGQLIKGKYPQYQNVPDEELTTKIVNKYPQYRNMVAGNQNLSSVIEQAGFDSQSQQPQEKKSLFDRAAEGVKKLPENYLKLTGGNKVAQSIGTLGGLGYEKLKGALGGQDNSEFYDTSAPSVGETALDAVRMVGTASAIKGAGGLLNKALHRNVQTGLNSPAAQEAIKHYIPDDYVGNKSLNQLMQPDQFSNADKFDAISKALKKANPSDRFVLQKALDELTPTILKEQGLLSFAQSHPALAKTASTAGKVAGKTAKWGLGLGALLTGGYYGTRGLLGQLVKGKDLDNRSRAYNQP